MIMGRIFRNWNKTCYISSLLSTEMDDYGNEINKYGIPVEYKFNAQPANGKYDITLYGATINKVYKAIVPYKYHEKIKEGDIAYLNGEIPLNMPIRLKGKGKIITSGEITKGGIEELHIYGDNDVFNLFSSLKLFPSKLIFPSSGTSVIKVTDQNGKITKYDLGITSVLRKNGNICDEIVIKNGITKEIRRINENGSIMEKPIEKILKPIDIKISGNKNIIEVDNYNANIELSYILTDEVNGNYVVDKVMPQNLATAIYFKKIEQ